MLIGHPVYPRYPRSELRVIDYVPKSAQRLKLPESVSNCIQGMSLDGKVALITGASRGIGKAIALRLARDGASVVINFSNDPLPAETIVQQLGNDRAIAVKANVAEISEVKRLVKETVDKFGKIDILVNCAGILPMSDLKNTTEETFEKAFGVNVKGPYFLTQALALTISLIIGGRQTHGKRISCHLFLFHYPDCIDRGASLFTI